MLPAARRIRRAEEFRMVLRGPARAATATLVVHAAPMPPVEHSGSWEQRALAPARVGFVVSRAVGGSVVRHRVTRRLRHLMAAQLADLPDGVDFVVRALPPAADAPSATLARDLSRALARTRKTMGPDLGTPRTVTQ